MVDRKTRFKLLSYCRMISIFILLSITWTCSGSVAAESGYDFEYPYKWADPQAASNSPKSALTKSWSPAPQPRSFKALIRDVVTERQAFLGLPFGALAAVGGVSAV